MITAHSSNMVDTDNEKAAKEDIKAAINEADKITTKVEDKITIKEEDKIIIKVDDKIIIKADDKTAIKAIDPREPVTEDIKISLTLNNSKDGRMAVLVVDMETTVVVVDIVT